MKRHWLAATTISFAFSLACVAWAADLQPANAAAPQASTQAAVPNTPITSGEDVLDPDFRFSARALALERRVEMRQWQRDAGGAYEAQWSAAQIDSSAFDRTHANPARFPFNGARWWTHAAQLQGSAVAADVLGTLAGWQSFAPDLRQLPPNLAASFQPDGDWLSTSQDPGKPVVGDVRLQWQVLKQAMPPPGIVLGDGEWRLPDKAVVTTQPATPPTVKPTAVASPMQRLFGSYVTWLLGAGVVIALLILLARRRRH